MSDCAAGNSRPNRMVRADVIPPKFVPLVISHVSADIGFSVVQMKEGEVCPAASPAAACIPTAQV
jgi:hypothetical protein